MTRLRADAVKDTEFVDQVELASAGPGATAYRTGVGVTSTTNSTSRVVLADGGAVEGDNPLEPGDLFTLSGSSGGADGTYTVEAVVDDDTFDVVEAINDSTGGTASFRHQAGARRVGADSSGLSHSAAGTVQEVLEDLDGEIRAPGDLVSAEAVGSTSAPTTTSSTFVTLDEMTATVTTAGNHVLVTFSGTFELQDGDSLDFAIFEGSTENTGSRRHLEYVSASGAGVTAGSIPGIVGSVSALYTGLSAGSHTFTVKWKCVNGTARAVGTQRSMVVKEMAGHT